MKFKSQRVDKVHGNYFIYNLFGPDSNRRHKKSKSLFACQNHWIKPPPKNKFKLEGEASYYVNGVYISTNLDAWCRLFHR